MSDPGFPKPYPKMKVPSHRPKEMKVLALGLSRTGTMSLYVALKKMGYNCYHMAECGFDSANGSMIHWHEAIDAKYDGKGQKYVGKDFDKMLWRYDAVTDIPCVLFVDELLEAYPDAQIVLTNRDAQGWVASVEHSIYEILSWKRWSLLELFDREHTYHYIPILRAALIQWTGGDWKNRSKLPDGLAAHNDHVRRAAAAAGREVLEFRPQNGWEPLCQFLGKEIPNEPFPHVNEGDWVVGLHYFIFWIRWLIVVLGVLKWVAPMVVVGMAIWWYQYRTI